MPQNKRESLIYTIMMCFFMVLWMSIYNVALLNGSFHLKVLQESWIGFPIAYLFAMCCDWFFVSKFAKGIAFRYFIKPTTITIKKVLIVSCCMVIPMVIIMSLYGGLEACFHTNQWNALPIIWLTHIPKNFIMALPFQIVIAGPVVRFLFRKNFPEGTILA